MRIAMLELVAVHAPIRQSQPVNASLESVVRAARVERAARQGYFAAGTLFCPPMSRGARDTEMRARRAVGNDLEMIAMFCS